MCRWEFKVNKRWSIKRKHEHNAGNFKVFWKGSAVSDWLDEENIWVEKSQSRKVESCRAVRGKIRNYEQTELTFYNNFRLKCLFGSWNRVESLGHDFVAWKMTTIIFGPLRSPTDKKKYLNFDSSSSWVSTLLSSVHCDGYKHYPHPLRALSEGKRVWLLTLETHFPILCCVWNAIEENHSVWFMRRWTLMHASLSLWKNFSVYFEHEERTFSALWKIYGASKGLKTVRVTSRERCERDWNSRFVVPHQAKCSLASVDYKGDEEDWKICVRITVESRRKVV